MIEDINSEWFEGVEEIVSDDLRFKKKLAIGEDAYKLLKAKKIIGETWDTVSAAGTGVAAAQSAIIAQSFFASTSLLSKATFGLLGASSAVTPIGWVIAAGVLSGSAWYMVTKKASSSTSDRVTVIPEFINTPIDVLSLGIFNLICPLAIKVGTVDGYLDEKEITHIENYFVKEWGLNNLFVQRGISYISDNIQNVSTKETAKHLWELTKNNPDCNQDEICSDVIGLLKDVMRADGIIDEREEMIIEQIEKIIGIRGKFNFVFSRN